MFTVPQDSCRWSDVIDRHLPSLCSCVDNTVIVCSESCLTGKIDASLTLFFIG